MKPVRLAVLAALVVVAVAAIAWVAGPVDVGHPRFSLGLNFDVELPEQQEQDEDLCEESGLGCAEEQPGAVSDAVSVGTFVFALALLGVVAWLVGRLFRKLIRELRDVRLPIPMDETVDAHIREALRDASQEAAKNVEGVPAGDATDAVVASWVLLERAAERVGTPRAAAATPTEFTVHLLREHDADPRAVSTLLDLYHQARFGPAPLPDSAAETAADALRTIANSLSGAVPSAPTEDAS
ncbi:MAG TPA: DUF4129 domain-containing protein [Jiangellaceae bacterium]